MASKFTITDSCHCDLKSSNLACVQLIRTLINNVHRVGILTCWKPDQNHASNINSSTGRLISRIANNFSFHWVTSTVCIDTPATYFLKTLPFSRQYPEAGSSLRTHPASNKWNYWTHPRATGRGKLSPARFTVLPPERCAERTPLPVTSNQRQVSAMHAG